ncbi:LysR family transcriptional regulator [Paucidesulfovibrio longus]|uniref:LysR family transcriptional regulator n=1 Tax=Paucidesulfovibrio longus TaxID=889 RepID=UPI0003B613BF|nr:LysR family transcriptional regulator [Paucidesulfovibrio longus]
MELYQLRTFVAVAEEKHLTRASERLFVSQPAVSAHIKALEKELGVKLFRRTARGMELTREGDALKPKADAVLASARELVFLARAMGDELVGNFKLGLNTDVDFLRLNALLSCMMEKHPRVAVTLLHSTSARIAEQVAAGNWDAGFVFTPPRYTELAAMPLFTFRLYVAGHEKFRDALQNADWPDLAALPWIWTTANCPYHRLVRKIFDGHNLTPAQIIEADSEAVVRSLLSAGKGLALLREDEVETLSRLGGLAVWPGESHEVQAYFIYLLAREKDPMIRAVRHCVAEMWEGAQLGPLRGMYAENPDEAGEVREIAPDSEKMAEQAAAKRKTAKKAPAKRTE